MRMILAAGLALLVPAAGALAQDPAPPAQGLLQGAEAGDIACYLRLRDDHGRSRNVMAEFEICEKAGPLIGQRVALSWRQGRVQHPACQGNPDCRRSQQVMLVTAMTPVRRP
ncbi:hypothetical protein KTR66_19765 [Roseococcus sp. SDR]|uniref:hypothetical protein n=1 Tax=Roseococcus sp. SDR TaxID=2835532 RepID=UPI001BD0AB13|nr:hypothetical protein [Roseococcus sp. SDR]MBS7792246.1 hypothetical protein [Roseococcus sp. SDR]MBV1847560.1 hypothetical protein [Roseococcus sp. SDR]